MMAARTVSVETSTKTGMPVVVHRAEGQAGSAGTIVLLHERYGLAQHTLDLAGRFAAFGYTVLTPDLFYAIPDQEGLRKGTVRATPPDSEVLALLEEVTALPEADFKDPKSLAMIGVCQTGRYPLLFASRHPLGACVLLYGGAGDWDKEPGGRETLERIAGAMGSPVLGIFGEKDHTISLDAVLQLRDVLERHNRSYQVHVFADMPHGWLNDTMAGRYRKPQAEEAISEIAEFIGAQLGDPEDDAVQWSFRCAVGKDYDFSKNVRYE